jgi:hypothetical protein
VKEIEMARNSDWLPSRQEEFVTWSQHFVNAMEEDYLALGLTNAVFTALKAKQTTFMEYWTEIQMEGPSSDRTSRKNTLVKNHKTYIRGWVNQYLRGNPLLTDDIRNRLGMPKVDDTRTTVPTPANQATANHRPLGDHLLELVLEIVGDIHKDTKASDYGFRIYWGIRPTGGASVEAATGVKRELIKVPIGGVDLPFSRFTRRHKELFDFDEADRGKTVYFCIQLENSKGDAGPWGSTKNTSAKTSVRAGRGNRLWLLFAPTGLEVAQSRFPLPTA